MLEPGAQQLKRGKCNSARCGIEAPRPDSQKRQFHWSQICVHVPFLGAIAKKQKATASFVMSVCPYAWNNLAPTRILMKFDF